MDKKEFLDTILSGEEISREEFFRIVSTLTTEELCDMAHIVTEEKCKKHFDFCSIVNARSGRCTEDCKWCAQSRHWNTSCEIWGWIGTEKCVEEAMKAESQGISRFALVTSGRGQKREEVVALCDAYKTMREKTRIHLCGSLGLLGKEDLLKLKEAGLERYHCNLETSPSKFPELCTTHTTEDKLNTLKYAKEIGLEVCCGGIIGMGETEEQLVEFAYTVKEVNPESIPVNILHPIKGTPLETMPRIDEEHIFRAIAILRLVNPTTPLRFAGGRRNLSDEAAAKAIHIGVTAGIAGVLLTTMGADYNDDRQIALNAGYDVEQNLR